MPLPNDFTTGYGSGQEHFQATGFQANPLDIFGTMQGQRYQSEQAQKRRDFEAQQAQAGYGFQGQQAQFGREFQGQQAEAQRAMELQQSNIAAEASKYPYELKQQRFSQLFPMFQQSFGNFSNPPRVGGSSGASPEISVGGVYNPQQIQQQVNASHAATDQAAQVQQHQMASNLAGRGYGGNSPLLQALQQGAQNQALATNTANERTTRMNAAQKNAGQVLSTQQARESQYATRQQEDIARRQQLLSQSNALLAAIGGLA